MRVDDDVSRAGIVWRRLDEADRTVAGNAGDLRRHVRPAHAAVARDVHETIVTANPDQAFRARRFRDGKDRCPRLDTGVVAGDRSARPLLAFLVIGRQVRADHRPRLAAIGGPEQHLRGVIDHVRIVWRARNRRGPLKAIPHVFPAMARWILGPGADVTRLLRAMVVARDDAEILAGVHDVGIVRLRDDVAGFTSADVVPVRARDAGGVEAVAWQLRGAEIL